MSGTMILVDPDVIEACVERADKTIEVQRHELGELQSRTEALIRLTVAGLGGIHATTGIMVASGVLIARGAVVGLASGTLGLLASLFFFITVITGLPRSRAIMIGPAVERLVAEMRVHSWDIHSYSWHVLETLRDAAINNSRLLRTVTSRQAKGIAGLVVSSVILTASLAYIIGGTNLA